MSESSFIKLLLVDDSKAFLSGVVQILSSMNLQIQTCTCVDSALICIKDFSPDIIVTDLEMPTSNGFDLIRSVRSDVSKSLIPILALTGSSNTDAMSKAIECGADAFMAKEDLRYAIVPQIQAFIRLKETFSAATKGKQLKAVQTLIGTYKHEFGNILAIFDGKLNRLRRDYPELKDNPAMENLVNSVERFKGTLSKLNELRDYKEENYSGDASVLKVG